MTTLKPKNGTEPATIEIPYYEWTQHREEAIKAMAQVDTLSTSMHKLIEHVACLPKITEILGGTAVTLEEIKTELLAAATNKDHVPLKVFLAVIGVISAGFFFALAIASGRHLHTPWMSAPMQERPTLSALTE